MRSNISRVSVLVLLSITLLISGCSKTLIPPVPTSSPPNQTEENTKAAVSLSASPSQVSPGQTITVTFSGAPGNQKDFIALYKVGVPNGQPYVSYKFLNGAKSGTLTFTAPTTSGDYEFRMFKNNTWTYLGKSNTIKVIATTVIVPPTGFSVSSYWNTAVSPGFPSFSLSWNVVSGATGYEMWVRPSGGSYVCLGIRSAPYVTFNSNSLPGGVRYVPGTTYYFKIRTVTTFGMSGFTNEVSCVAASPTPTPTLTFAGTGSPYTCGDNCSSTSHFDGLNEISIVNGSVAKTVKIYPTNGTLNGSEYVVIYGSRWVPYSDSYGYFNTSSEEICNSLSPKNGYEVKISGGQIIISLSTNKNESFKAVPWIEVMVTVKTSQNGTALGSYVFSYNEGTQSIGGIFPRIESAYGQCVWWAIRRFWEVKGKEIWPPFYPSQGRTKYSVIYPKTYNPQFGDVLIRDGGGITHYAFIENVEDYVRPSDGTLYKKIKISQYNYPYTQLGPSYQVLYWRPDRETKMFTTNTTGDPIAPNLYQFNYYIR